MKMEGRLQTFKVGSLTVNPVTQALAFAGALGLALYASLNENALAELEAASASVVHYFLWLIVLAPSCGVLVIIYIYFVYGNVVLGKPGDKPEISRFSISCISLASLLMADYLSVMSSNYSRFGHEITNRGTASQDDIDMFSIVYAVFYWGPALWAFMMTGVFVIGILCNRDGYPFLPRTMFFPLLKEHTWGWIGDIIDSISIVSALLGVGIALVYSVLLMIQGLEELGLETLDSDQIRTACIIGMWIAGGISCASTISGIGTGIRIFSFFGFCILFFLLVVFLTFDDGRFLLNVTIEAGSTFVWNLFPIMFATGAFGQQNHGSGKATDGKGTEVWWQGFWHAFYYVWWFNWGPTVSIFLGKICKGLTIRQAIHSAFFVPVLATFGYSVIFASVGVNMNRRALELESLGLEQFGNASHFALPHNPNCFVAPTEAIVISEANNYYASELYIDALPGTGPTCKFDVFNPSNLYFQVLNQYGAFGPFFVGGNILLILSWFVSISDSMSLVHGMIVTNGQGHWFFRAFWSLMQALVGSTLIATSQENTLTGNSAIYAFQYLMFLTGVPLAFMIFFEFWSFFELMDKNQDRTHFQMPVYGGAFSAIQYIFSFGQLTEHSPAKDWLNKATLNDFIIGVFVPFWGIKAAQTQLGFKEWPDVVQVTFLGVLFFAVLGFGFAAISGGYGLGQFAFVLYCCFALCLSFARNKVRMHFKISGNIASDFLSSFCLYFQVVAQILNQLRQDADVRNANAVQQDAEEPSSSFNDGAESATQSQHSFKNDVVENI